MPETPTSDDAQRPEDRPDAAPNVSQLRDAIDHGRTRDKVAAPDPAAAPLGTDEEAAGRPATPDALRGTTADASAQARAAERRSYGGTLAVVAAVLVVLLVIAVLLR